MRLENFIEDYIDINEGIEDIGIFKAVFMAGQAGSGKAQPLYCKVLTDNGWKNMGELKVGDIVQTPNNKFQKIIQIHQQGIKEVYEVELFDGRKTYCTKDHLWKVHGFYSKINSTKRDKNNRKISIQDWSVRKTSELIEKKDLKYLKNRIHLPLPKSINFNENISIHPYILGVILGDGGTTSGLITITSRDSEIIEKTKSLLVENHSINKLKGKYQYSLVGNGKRNQNYYINKLRKYNLFKLKSNKKFIPNNYKHSTIENRLELIKGLIDTDGYISKSGQLYFYTTSKRLSDDFRYIIWSLGDNSILHEKIPTLNGIKHKKCYCITILSHEPEKYVYLERKRKRLFEVNLQKRNKNHNLKCRIKNITYIGNDKCQCITIDDTKGLYITDNFIVTHNSYLLKKIKSGTIEPRIVNIDKYIEADYIDKTKKLVVSQLALYLNSCLPLFIDATASIQQAIVTRYGLLESIGYDNAMVFVNTPLELSIKRAAERKVRPVEADFVIKSYKSLQKIKGFLRTKFPLFIEITNTEEEIDNKVILNIFKKISFFYTSPVKNPVGQYNIEIMKKNKWKYLTPNIYTENDLKQLAKMWFRTVK